MQLINKEYNAVIRAQQLQNLLHALFKLAPILGTGYQHAQLQGKDNFLLQKLRYLAMDNFSCEGFGHSSFTYAGFADDNRIIFGATA